MAKMIIQRGGLYQEVTSRPLSTAEIANIDTDCSYQSDHINIVLPDGVDATPITIDISAHDNNPFTVFVKGIKNFISIKLQIIVNAMGQTIQTTIVQLLGGSGNYTLQANGNALSDWTTLATDTSQPTSGSFSLPDVTVNNAQLIPGQTYQFRVLDTTTSVTSNIVSFTVPAASGAFSFALLNGTFAINPGDYMPAMDLSESTFTNGSGNYLVRVQCVANDYDNSSTISGPENGTWGANGYIDVPQGCCGETIIVTVSDPVNVGVSPQSVTLVVPECAIMTLVTGAPSITNLIQIDGSGMISFGDGSDAQSYSNSGVAGISHTFAAAGTYTIVIYNITSMTSIALAAGDSYGHYPTIAQLPDGLLSISVAGNQITDSGVFDINNPSTAMILLDISSNEIDTTMVDNIIESMNDLGLSAPFVLRLQNQTPLAPPSTASAAALAALIARGVTVNHD